MTRCVWIVLPVIAIALAACTATTTERKVPAPPIQSESTPIDTPDQFVAGSHEWDACVKMYDAAQLWREKMANSMPSETACATLKRTNSDATLMEAFANQEWIDEKLADMLAEADPITPHYLVTFDGTGTATATWVGSDGNMIQRDVTLPYTETVNMQDFLTSNVIQFGGSVGCKIEVISNDHRDGLIVSESPLVDGQTLASCTTD